MSRTQYQYTLEDADPKELADCRQSHARAPAHRACAARRGIRSAERRLAGASLDIDRVTASRLGITPQLIDDTLYDAFGQRQVSTMFTQLNQYRVILEVKPEFQKGPGALQNVFVRPQPGAQVPFSAFTTVTELPTPLAINHQGQFPAVTLSFNIAPGASLGEAVKAIEQVKLELDLPPSVQGGFQGAAQAFRASLSNQLLLILAAVVAVYIVLGVLYESYIHPVTILSTLPSAGMGALLALHAHAHRSVRDRADRHYSVDRHRAQERDHDDRLRARGRAPARHAAARRDLSGVPAALPADYHDDAGRAARRVAARAQHRRRRGAAAPARHQHRRRI